jgi:hypothetical protein
MSILLFLTVAFLALTSFWYSVGYMKYESVEYHIDTILSEISKPQDDESREKLLNELISDGAWNGGDILSLANFRYILQTEDLGMSPRQCLSPLSSVYYTCASRRYTKARSLKGLLLFPFRLWHDAIAVWYLTNAMVLSDKLEKIARKEREPLSVNEISVRTSILMRVRRFKKALLLVNEAILTVAATPKVHRSNDDCGKLALLYMNKAEISAGLGMIKSEVDLSYRRSVNFARASCDPKILVRVLPAVASSIKKTKPDEAKDLLYEARILASYNEMWAQEEKILEMMQRS